jgi:hypothetical protein
MKRIYLIVLIISSLTNYSVGQNLGSPEFFPIAVWLQNTENAMQYKQEAGINMYIGLWNQLDEKQFTNLKNAGIKLICSQNEFGLTHKNDSTIIGWMNGDEPDNAQWNKETRTYDSCIEPKQIIDFYKKVKETDPTHPFYLNLGQGVSYTDWIGRGLCRGRTELYPVANNGYLNGCDIVSFDIYPVNSNDPNVSEKLWMVAKGIDSLRVWSNNTKPVWTWIETTKIGNDSPRKPTPEEVKTQVWMALIHGAKGIGYFCHSFYPKSDDAALLHDKVMLTKVKEINQQISSLAIVLNTETKSDFAKVKSTSQNVPIDMMVKLVGNASYIFAVAMRNEPTTATFTIQTGNQAEVLGESRTINITSRQFEDHFDGYGVHIYRISE